jgi:polyisoprenoid-binding protein YceI
MHGSSQSIPDLPLPGSCPLIYDLGWGRFFKEEGLLVNRIANILRRVGVAWMGILVVFLVAGDSTLAVSADPLPPPGTYQVDPVHSFVYFSAWHHIVGTVRGRFEKATGTIVAAAKPEDCSVDITIDTATLSTQNPKRDADLRGPDFFAVQKYPQATYRGRGIRHSGNAWVMDGVLTIRGVSKVVPLTFTFKGLFPDMPAGSPARAAFHGTAETHRGDFGMTRDNAMELGVPAAPGADVQLEIDVEADLSQPGH